VNAFLFNSVSGHYDAWAGDKTPPATTVVVSWQGDTVCRHGDCYQAGVPPSRLVFVSPYRGMWSRIQGMTYVKTPPDNFDVRRR